MCAAAVAQDTLPLRRRSAPARDRKPRPRNLLLLLLPPTTTTTTTTAAAAATTTTTTSRAPDRQVPTAPRRIRRAHLGRQPPAQSHRYVYTVDMYRQ